jgi:hypothetical protein
MNSRNLPSPETPRSLTTHVRAFDGTSPGLRYPRKLSVCATAFLGASTGLTDEGTSHRMRIQEPPGPVPAPP